jgi:hypothetical protein
MDADLLRNRATERRMSIAILYLAGMLQGLTLASSAVLKQMHVVPVPAYLPVMIKSSSSKKSICLARAPRSISLYYLNSISGRAGRMQYRKILPWRGARWTTAVNGWGSR